MPSEPAPESASASIFPFSPRRWGWVLAALILLGGVLRFYHLGDNPPWYTDELIYGDVARTLAEGQPRFGAIRFPFAREYVTKPPVWFLLDAPLQWLPGPAMTKARLLSALVSLVLVWVVFRLGKRLHSPEAGLIGAWVMLAHAPAMLYFRWATPYDLAGLFNALAVWFLAEEWMRRRESGITGAPADNRFFYAAALMVGLSAMTDFFSLQAVAFVWVWVVLSRRWRALPGTIGLAVAPSLIFLVWGLAARGGNFAREWMSLFFQFEGSGIGAAVRQMLHAAWITWTHDAVYFVGIVGLAVWAIRGRGRLVGLFFLFMLPLMLRRQGYDPAVPHNMPSYCFAFDLGFGVALCAVGRWVWRGLSRFAAPGSVWPRAVGAVVLVAPPAVMTVFALGYLWTGIPMKQKAVGSVRNVDDTRAVCALLNSELSPTDLAVVPDRLVVFLNCRAVPIVQAVYEAGLANTWMRYVQPGDFLFRPDPARARVVVIDAFNRIDGLQPEDPNCTNPFAVWLRKHRWHLADRIGEYWIYLPPKPRP